VLENQTIDRLFTVPHTARILALGPLLAEIIQFDEFGWRLAALPKAQLL